MILRRRMFTAATAALLAVPTAVCAGAQTETLPMYGLINKITAAPGKGPDLAALLLNGAADMAGCVSYVIAADAADSDVLWITEVWTNEAAHKASLTLPAVRGAIEAGRPMIAGFERISQTQVIGGSGL